MNPFLPTLSPIWQSPTCVFLDDDRLAEAAQEMARDTLPIPNWRDPVFPSVDDDTFIDFIGVGNSINFAFTDFNTHKSFSITHKGVPWYGAYGMWACLMRALEADREITDGRYLGGLDQQICADIFSGETPIPLLEERYRILREVGHILVASYDGRFSALFKKAGYRAFGGQGVVDRLITEFPSFVDESLHKTSQTMLKFNKRAQLLPMMYQGRAASSSTLAPLLDFEDLGPISDYAVPRGLRKAGILKYSPDLEDKIQKRVLIARDSIEEQEIRAQTNQVQFKLWQLISPHRPGTTMLNIDYRVWSLGRGAKEPHHLTVTTAY